MLDLGFLLLLTLWSIGVGLRLLRRLEVAPDRPADAVGLAIPLGLGVLALASFGLGECGLLNRGGLAAVVAAGAWFGWKAGLEGARCWGRVIVEAARRPSAFDLLMGVGLLGTLLTAMAPVTDGDALCYHLQVPKVFLARGALTFEPDLHETIYPLVTEMLYAVALASRGPVACRLVQWLLGLSFALNATSLARPVLGDRARWAGTIALLVPAVSNGMGAPLNDVALAAFGNAALVAWLRWHDRPTGRAAVLAGLLAGLAIGVKYPALVLAGLIGGGMLVEPIRNQNFKFEISNFQFWMNRNARHAAIFGATALLIGGGWYLRAFVHTGNPVFPFFRGAFGGAGLDEVLEPAKRPMAVTLGNLLTAIGPLTLEPDRFDSVAHQLGPAFLLFLPGLFLFRAPRRVWAIVGMGWLFLTLCLTQRQSMRFVLIAVGPLAVGVAWLAAHWWDRRGIAGRSLTAAVVLVLAFEASIALARARHGLDVVAGRESAESYLARREPTFVVGRWIDANLPGSARLIGQDHRGFYLPRDYTMELAHRRRTGLGTRGESALAIVAHFRGEGFTHLLLCPPIPEDAIEFDPTLGRRLGPWLADREPIYRADLADADGVVRRYAIYELVAATTSPSSADREAGQGGRR